MSESLRDVTAEEARAIGERIGIDWGSARFDVEQLRIGLGVELEHGAQPPAVSSISCRRSWAASSIALWRHSAAR